MTSTARFSTVLRSRYKAIAEVVANEYGMPYEDLAGKDRHKQIAEARQVLCYVLRHATWPQWSFPEIGGACGGRDHTTVMSNVRRIERRIQSEPHLRTMVERVVHLAKRFERFPDKVEPIKSTSDPPPPIPDLEVA